MGVTHYGADRAITGRNLRGSAWRPQRLGAGHAWYGLALCGRPLLVLLLLLILLVLRMAGDLQERGMSLLHFGNNPAKMP
jgi:hypothetical protein